MTKSEILSHVDYTLLKAFAPWSEYETLCREALEYQTATVCVPPCYVKKIKEIYGEGLKVCTVIGFPLGYQTAAVKAAETREAVADGADEIDMVINISDVKNGDYDKVEDEIRLIKEACGEKLLKVIVEACYLTEEEKIAMCRAVTNAGAEYIKTSTGFGTGGAVLEDVKLFRKHIGPDVKIKAAGGIRSLEAMEAFLEAGASRIGSSSCNS